MRCTIIFIYVSLFTFSCNKKNRLLTPIYSACCYDQDRSISISKDGIVILENDGMFLDKGEKKHEYLLNIIKTNGDTLKEIDSTLNLHDYQKTKEIMKRKPFYYDSIGKIKFVYNKIPSALSLKFTDDEEISHLISYKDKHIFTTFSFGLKAKNYSEKNKLYVQSQNGNHIEIANLEMYTLPTSELLLYDIIGDEEPEIFVINNYYFMNHYLTNFDIYKINFN